MGPGNFGVASQPCYFKMLSEQEGKTELWNKLMGIWCHTFSMSFLLKSGDTILHKVKFFQHQKKMACICQASS